MGEGAAAGSGVGEAEPLPGLHSESWEDAAAQLKMLAQRLPGVAVPRTLALLSDGVIDTWLVQNLGLRPQSLLPSVRCALEAALLSAVADGNGVRLAQLLAPRTAAAAAGPVHAYHAGRGVASVLACSFIHI